MSDDEHERERKPTDFVHAHRILFPGYTPIPLLVARNIIRGYRCALCQELLKVGDKVRWVAKSLVHSACDGGDNPTDTVVQ